jgi:hypothetical protein
MAKKGWGSMAMQQKSVDSLVETKQQVFEPVGCVLRFDL